MVDVLSVNRMVRLKGFGLVQRALVRGKGMSKDGGGGSGGDTCPCLLEGGLRSCSEGGGQRSFGDKRQPPPPLEAFFWEGRGLPGCPSLFARVGTTGH